MGAYSILCCKAQAYSTCSQHTTLQEGQNQLMKYQLVSHGKEGTSTKNSDFYFRYVFANTVILIFMLIMSSSCKVFPFNK